MNDHELERLFAMATDLLAIADGDGRFVRLNPAWEGVLGWPLDEMLGVPFTEFVHPEDFWKTTSACKAARAAGAGTATVENRYRTQAGEWRWMWWSATWDGECWYAVAKDITGRKALEGALAAAEPIAR